MFTQGMTKIEELPPGAEIGRIHRKEGRREGRKEERKEEHTELCTRHLVKCSEGV